MRFRALPVAAVVRPAALRYPSPGILARCAALRSLWRIVAGEFRAAAAVVLRAALSNLCARVRYPDIIPDRKRALQSKVNVG